MHKLSPHTSFTPIPLRIYQQLSIYRSIKLLTKVFEFSTDYYLTLKMSKRQSQTVVPLRTAVTQMTFFNPGMSHIFQVCCALSVNDACRPRYSWKLMNRKLVHKDVPQNRRLRIICQSNWMHTEQNQGVIHHSLPY